MPTNDKQPNKRRKNAYRRDDYLKRRPTGPPAPTRRPMRTALIWMVIIGALFMIVSLAKEPSKPDEWTLDTFEEKWKNGEIESIEHVVNIGEQELIITLKAKGDNDAEIVVMPIPENDLLLLNRVKKLKAMEIEGVSVTITNTRPSRVWRAVLFNMLPWVLIFVVIYFVFFRQLRSGAGGAGGILSFGRSQANIFNIGNNLAEFFFIVASISKDGIPAFFKVQI